ncbi:MarR family winged helix-turn-helix transcriptional regulator [Segnochrobactrum spirostomi]|uniref:Winged helix-turn-helix transcriptional regulator n=1 Tax=Segnochrobactrum spirostomi TaxID=2608987 RepID=A0A6A7Y7G9_9HYPH|nr:MarR family winged helix-turn-helix transcriptional regulator [Segnochrobactrum spirostomi]MQT13602.1 winged helix-turn-helix transcriptional regulator [Segnochrobactrum spirostomi]
MTAPIEDIRAASRRLVRELGFMGDGLAGTDLPPSAVHALIEIDAHPGITAGEIAGRLRLEKSSVSRMLRKLVESGTVQEAAGPNDARTKALALSADGQALVAGIHRFARLQVSSALGRLEPAEALTVAEGIRLYADALTAANGGVGEAGPAIRIETGYHPGLIGRIATLHARHYARVAGFGAAFEAVVATGLAEFSARLDRPANRIWRGMQGDDIVGSIAIDGEDLGAGKAHLRWFIVDDGLRGRGVGRGLIAAATAFADAQGFGETHLWTLRGLEAARHLYEAHGFVLAEEWLGTQWGTPVQEQRYVRLRPA